MAYTMHQRVAKKKKTVDIHALNPTRFEDD